LLHAIHHVPNPDGCVDISGGEETAVAREAKTDHSPIMTPKGENLKVREVRIFESDQCLSIKNYLADAAC